MAHKDPPPVPAAAGPQADAGTEVKTGCFLDRAGQVCAGVPVGRDQIVYSFAGVHPVPQPADTPAGFASRDYRIERRQVQARTAPAGAVAGTAEAGGAVVLGELGLERTASTAKPTIGGGAGFPDSGDGVRRRLKARLPAGCDAARTAGLLPRYDTCAADAITCRDRDRAGGPDQGLRSTGGPSVREPEFMARHEQVGHLADALIRRPPLAFRGLVAGEMLHEVADILAGPPGWDRAARVAEISDAGGA